MAPLFPGGLLVLAATLGGCAGQPEFARGHAGSPPPGRTVALVLAPGAQASALGPPLRAAAVAALARHGLEVADDAPVHIEVAVGERPSGMTITGADGSALAPGISRQFLQSCRHRTWRLAMVWFGDGTASGRGVAERASCHGRVEDMLPGLAERAAAELTRPRG
jgi:hypothetical protein